MKPTVGRIVHFYDNTMDEPQAAIITRVHTDHLVNVSVFPDGERHHNARVVTSVHDGPAASPNWCWPPRE